MILVVWGSLRLSFGVEEVEIFLLGLVKVNWEVGSRFVFYSYRYEGFFVSKV